MTLDRRWYLDVNSFSRHTHWLHGFMSAYANWAGLVVLALMVVGGWLWARHRRSLDGVVAAVLAGLSALIALGINHFVSQAVARVRPCHATAILAHHPTVILSCAHDYSFPSDHAIIAGALATGLVFVNRKLGAIAVVLALLLAFARVYAGVHYPGDVVAGLLAGAAIAVIVWLVLRRPATALAARIAATPLSPLIGAGVTTKT